MNRDQGTNYPQLQPDPSSSIKSQATNAWSRSKCRHLFNKFCSKVSLTYQYDEAIADCVSRTSASPFAASSRAAPTTCSPVDGAPVPMPTPRPQTSVLGSPLRLRHRTTTMEIIALNSSYLASDKNTGTDQLLLTLLYSASSVLTLPASAVQLLLRLRHSYFSSKDALVHFLMLSMYCILGCPFFKSTASFREKTCLYKITLIISACESKENNFSFDNLGKEFASCLKVIQLYKF